MKSYADHKFVLFVVLCCFFWISPLWAAPLSWVPGPLLPAPRSDAVAVVMSDNNAGTVVVTGGATSVTPTLNLALPLFATAWSYAGTGLDTTHIALGAGVLTSNQIVIFGGHDGDRTSLASAGSIYLYGDFFDIAPMTVARSYLGSAQDGNKNIYALGGLDAAGVVLSSAERFYDSSGVPPTSVWISIAPLPTARFGFPAVFDGSNDIYTFGGGTINDASSISNTVYRYTISNNTWTTMAPMPLATRESAAVRGLNGKIYVLGGLSASGVTAAVQVYDTTTDTWSTETALPNPVRAAAAVFDKLSRIMLIGGTNDVGSPVASVWVSQSLSVPDAIPAFTSTPITVGSVGTAYTYAVKASGSPPPTFSLPVAPAGMTIDTFSGVIAWTPATGQAGVQAVTVQASNSLGSVTQSFTINVASTPPDITPPSAPTGLTASGITQTSFQLSWNAASDNIGVTGYRVYLVTTCGFRNSQTCYTLQQTVTGTSTTITGLLPANSYSYSVGALDAAGNVSAPALAIRVTMLYPPVLLHLAQCGGGIENIVAIVNSNLQILCGTSGFVGGIGFYQVQTAGNPVPSLSIASGPAGMVVSATGAVTWAPVAGTPGTYIATVRSTNSEGSADLSFAYTIYPADTDVLAPSSPGVITISNITQTSMTANWTGATDNVGVAGYLISASSYYCKPTGTRRCSTTAYNFPKTTGSARSFTLTGLLANRNYTVNIRAFDAVGNYGPSAYSALAVTPP